MSSYKDLKIGDDTFQIDADPKDAIIIQRHFARLTKRDLEIESFTIPSRPLWLRLVIKAIRFYQKHLSKKLGNRCVFDPSCSHYAEVAFRKEGFFRGIKLTFNRLKRCRPTNGGVDELN